jgi:hypothetical protein
MSALPVAANALWERLQPRQALRSIETLVAAEAAPTVSRLRQCIGGTEQGFSRVRPRLFEVTP